LGGLSSTVPAAGALHLAGHVEGAAKEVDVLDPKAGGLAEPKTGERTERDEGAECFVCGLEDGADLGGGGQGHRRSSSTAAGECDTDARIAGDQLVGDGPAEDGADVVDPGVHRPGRESSVDHALTQPSTCERRRDRRGRSVKGTDPAANVVLRADAVRRWLCRSWSNAPGGHLGASRGAAD
jgi:hypothetical protein